MKSVLTAALGLAGVLLIGNARAGEKGTDVKLDKYTSKTPATWQAQEIEPKLKKFRTHQFKVPGTEKGHDAELVIFSFGGGGGSVDQNIDRWKKMFRPPEGKTHDDIAKVDTFKVGDIKITYLDISGTYEFRNPPFDPNAKLEKRPNYRMFSIYFDSEDGPYFIRMTGPAKTMEHNKKGFDEWLKNFK